MVGRVVVLEPKQYEAWLSGEFAKPSRTTAERRADVPEGSPGARGQKLFQDLGCQTCHHLDRQGIGPMLAGLFGKRQKLQSGATIIVDENYIRESILNPQAKITAGFQPLMPPFQGRINEEQVMELIAYIKSLGQAGVGKQ
jgi:cytochrome c oxidase subunit 2